MGLDIHWQEGRKRYQVGSIEVDNSLINLIDQFNQDTGLAIDLYGTSRIYLTQWEKLIQVAKRVGYNPTKLVAIRAKISPDNDTPGGLILEGD